MIFKNPMEILDRIGGANIDESPLLTKKKLDYEL